MTANKIYFTVYGGFANISINELKKLKFIEIREVRKTHLCNAFKSYYINSNYKEEFCRYWAKYHVKMEFEHNGISAFMYTYLCKIHVKYIEKYIEWLKHEREKN
jgi:hypothetical protein